MRMKNSKFYPALVLGTICLVATLLLSGVNMITRPLIEAAQNAATTAALLEVLPGGKNFEEIEITSEYPAIVTYSKWKLSARARGLLLCAALMPTAKLPEPR